MIGFITDNWLLKVVSLVFALVLWFFVMGERNLEIGYAVPLEIKNVPKGMMIANEVPNTVDVRLSGPRTMLMNLGPRDVGISVDLSDLKAGLTTFKRLEERLNIPTGIKVTRLSPAYIDLKLEPIRSKELPVRVVLSGRPAEGFHVVVVTAEPASVAVEGAEGELNALREVATDAVDLSGASAPLTMSVPVNYRGRYTQLKDNRTVEVSVQIEKGGSKKKTRSRSE
jgi:YbbR domain-containing protein